MVFKIQCNAQCNFVAFNQLNSGCSRQRLLNLHFPTVVADSAVKVFPELVKCAVTNSDQAVDKMLSRINNQILLMLNRRLSSECRSSRLLISS